LDCREDIQRVIMVHFSAMTTARVQKAILTELWRECDSQETMRLSRRAAGIQQDHVEDPLDGHVLEGLQTRFTAKYGWFPGLANMICDPLLGRIRRETDRRSHTLIPLERVRIGGEVSRTNKNKEVPMGDMTVTFNTSGIAKGPRTIQNTYCYLRLLEVLLVAYVFVGNFIHAGSTSLFATMQTAMDYLEYVRSRACPLNAPARDLSRVRKADEDTRLLWADRMRGGMSFDEAVKDCMGQQAAHWMWTSEADARKVRDATQEEQDIEEHPRGSKRSLQTIPNEIKKQRVISQSSSGKALCNLWNDGKCTAKGDCKNGRVHSCNHEMPNGKACGKHHRRCEAHD
jgi:hypothetical protein